MEALCNFRNGGVVIGRYVCLCSKCLHSRLGARMDMQLEGYADVALTLEGMLIKGEDLRLSLISWDRTLGV